MYTYKYIPKRIVVCCLINNYQQLICVIAGRPLKLVHLQHLTDANDDNGVSNAAAGSAAHKSSHRVRRSDTGATAVDQSDGGSGGALPQVASQSEEEVVSVQIKGKLITSNTH